jgi:uncharacterized membrane protein YphA (DoxX/SURF4 family)
MKKEKTIYWITTVLFVGFMAFSSIPDVLMLPEVIEFMNHLGYPNYFIPFIGIAKLLGVIAIIIPRFPKLKEWAYAGIFFDLIGAVYSVVSVDGLQAGMLVMVLPVGLGIVSYIYSHKLFPINN